MLIMGKKPYYKGLIFREFYFSEAMSCAELSERIGKSLPLTMKLLNELIAEGYVQESGYAPSSGGRRPAMYTLLPDKLYILSVAMDQLITRISLMDIHNRHVTGVHKFDLPLQKNPDALSTLAQRMEEVIVNSGVDREKIIGAGVAMPGFIDARKGINYSYLESGDLTLTKYLSQQLSLPVYIDNDSSLIALAEFRFGAARHQKNAMVINIGWGIGLGMILNGQLFRGHNGFAGEFSHMSLFRNNKLCYCGKTGCLETEASLMVVIEKAINGLKAGRLSGLGPDFATGHFEQDWEAIVNAALKGDQFIIELLSNTGYDIGMGVAILIHLVNPESVILSGRGALAGKVWQAPIQQALNEHSIPRLAANTTVAISTLGHQAELIGAASLVMDQQLKESDKPRKKEKKTVPLNS
jgi:predicted NBD/HSP70 family sugar kinase